MSFIVEQLQCYDLSQTFYPDVTFSEVELTDFYRKNKPYRLLSDPGRSSVTMTFGLSGSENVSKVFVQLNHRSTASGCVDLFLNDVRLNQNIAAPKDKFDTVSFQYHSDKFSPEGNVLKVQLGEESPGTYWLSDVTILVKRVADKTEDEIDRVTRQMLVNVRKLIAEREKLTTTLLDIAQGLDELQTEIEKYKANPEAYTSPECFDQSAEIIGKSEKSQNGVEHQINGKLENGVGGCGPSKQQHHSRDNQKNGVLPSQAPEKLLLLGQAALAYMSDQMGCSLKPEKQKAGYRIVVGAPNSPGTWDGVTTRQVIKDMDKTWKEDRRCRNMVASCASSLKKMVTTKEHEYLEKFPDVKQSTSFEVFGYRFAQSLSPGDALRQSRLYQSEFQLLSKALDCIPVAVLKKALIGEEVELDSSFTLTDYFLKVAELVGGSPLRIAAHLKQAAQAVDQETQHLRDFMNDNLTTLLRQLKEDLDLCNVRHAILRLSLLPIFEDLRAEQGFLDMTWLNTWATYDTPLPLPQLTSLANALNILYHQLRQGIKAKDRDEEEDGEEENGIKVVNGDGDAAMEEEELDLVIIANGSVGAPQGRDIAFPTVAKSVTLPAAWMFGTDRLASVTFYAPWGAQIDPSVFYGIITDDIDVDDLRILGLETEQSRRTQGHPGVPKSLDDFNTITHAAKHVTLPTVWCNSFEEGDAVLEQLTLLLECDKDRWKRPYAWWRLGSMPAYMLAALAGIAGMMLSSSGTSRRVHLHFAQCLAWPDTRNAPPKTLTRLAQYHNVVQQTFKTPCCFTITPL